MTRRDFEFCNFYSIEIIFELSLGTLIGLCRDLNWVRRYFYWVCRDFNWVRRDFNWVSRDFNWVGRDFNWFRRDFNWVRLLTL